MLTLKKSNEFQNVFKKGKWFGSNLLMIYVTKNKDNINKVGIAVGRKVAKSVKRNRIRRVIREAYRLNEDRLLKGNNIVIVWSNKASIEDASFENIQKSLMKCLEKAELIEIN